MQTKYLVILIVIVVIGSGLYFFQKHRQKKAVIAHNIEQLQRITKVAKKSSSAGLLFMATAINKFHKKKGQYPTRLLELYPEFIPEKSFILKLKWKYRPGKNTYLLQKTSGHGKMIASMGPDLRLKTGSDVPLIPAEMVASVDKSKAQNIPQKSEKKTKPKAPPKSEEKAMASKVSPKEPDIKKNTENDQLAILSPKKLLKTSADINPIRKRELYSSNPLTRIVTKDLNKDEKYLLSLDGLNFYIWKSNDGSVGFSNLQYPDEEDLAVYRNQNWIEYIEKPSMQ